MIFFQAPSYVSEIQTQLEEVNELMKNTLLNSEWIKLGPTDVSELSQISSALRSIKTYIEGIEQRSKEREVAPTLEEAVCVQRYQRLTCLGYRNAGGFS